VAALMLKVQRIEHNDRWNFTAHKKRSPRTFIAVKRTTHFTASWIKQKILMPWRGNFTPNYMVQSESEQQFSM
jgi:hypothetical protein